MQLNIQELRPDTMYTFTTKPWTAPTGEVIAGRELIRVFVGLKKIENVPFVEVERPGGRHHLIAVETIAFIASQ